MVHFPCAWLTQFISLPGGKCGSGATGSGEGSTNDSCGSGEGHSQARGANPTLHSLHKLSLWLVSVKSLPGSVENTGPCWARLFEWHQLLSKSVSSCHRDEPVLPMLTFAQKRGNPTFYEWRTGKAPAVIERPVMEEAPPDTVTEETVCWSYTHSILINWSKRWQCPGCILKLV